MADGDRWHHDVLVVLNVQVGPAHAGRGDAHHYFARTGNRVGKLSQFKVALAKRDFDQCFHNLPSLTRAKCPGLAG